MIIEFSKAVALLLALCLLQGFIARRWPNKELFGQVLSGLLFGGICVIGMTTPIEVSPGVIFDARSVVLSMSGLFGGPVIGGIAAVIAGGYRVWLGGGGAPVGVSVIISCVLLGLAYRYCHQRGWLQIGILQLLAFGLLVHLVEVSLFTFLPDDVVERVMESVALPLVLTFTPATALLGYLLHIIESQIQTDKSLLESEQRFKDYAGVSSDWFWEMDADLRYSFFSPTYVQHSGVSPEDAVGCTRAELYVDILPRLTSDQLKQWEKFNQFVEARETFRDCETTWIGSDGKVQFFTNSGKPTFDADGKFEGYRGIASNITKSKNQEEDLKEIAQRFRNLIEGSIQGVLIHANHKPLFANQAYAEIFGYDSYKEILAQESALDHVASHEHERMRAYHHDRLRGDAAPTNYEFEGIRKDGSSIWLENRAWAVNWDGQPAAQRTLVDITERKKAEQALQKSEARLAGILNIAPEAVIAIGEHLNIRLYNEGAERIFGYSADEILGRPMDILMPERFRENHSKHVQNFERSQDTYLLMNQRQEIMGLRKDGAEFLATASVSKLDMGGEKVFTVVLQDITERKKAEADIITSKEEAEFANRAKSEFLANMSHELRTPLNSIIGFSDMIMNEIFGPQRNPKYSDYGTAINVSGNHLLKIISDILDISKIEAGEATVEDTEIDVGKAVSDCIAMVGGRTEEAGVDVEAHMPDHLPALRADERQLKQIVINLLSNATKFTPEGGRVTVSARLDDNSGIEISVTDTGIGIAAEDIPKVLQPFGQVADSHIRNQGGTGLGLPICKSLMELHGGSLDIESELGDGTSVIVSFPPERTVQS